MKTFPLYILSGLLAHAAFAAEPVGDADFKAGYAIGKPLGEEWASLGQNMPLPQGLDFIASGQAVQLKDGIDPYNWKLGFKAGYADGFEEAKRTWRPSTAGSEKYDQPSYWAGYKAGFQSNQILGDERIRMHRRCDLEIESHHYKKDDYSAGFVAGTADADKQDGQKKSKKAEADRQAFKKKSYEAGYQTAHAMHLNEGGDITTSIELGLRAEREAKQYDRQSWQAGFDAAREKDTRP